MVKEIANMEECSKNYLKEQKKKISKYSKEKKPKKKKVSKKNYKKKAKEISEAINETANLRKPAQIFSRIGQAETFIERQPLFYDRKGLWWKWNFEKYCYEIIDETDILNSILDELNLDTTTSKPKTEILNALKQVGRKNIPEDSKSCWVQFGKKIIDIETEEEFESTPKYFITNPIPFELGKRDYTPNIDKLFISWVGEEHKEELYETLSFCCVPEYFIHRIICLIGSGANGKSTFLKILKKFIGIENITSSNLEMLLKSRFEGAKLYKKLVCLMGETNFNSIKRTEFLKGATGEDTLRGEFKGKTPFDFVSCAKWIMATNSLPVTLDKTDGYYRRWKIIDFNAKFKKEKDVLSKISKEEYENLSFKCLKIMKRLYKERVFTNDGDFDSRKKRYEEKSNPVMLFITKYYEKDINGNVIFSEFYEVLTDFLKDEGYRELTARAITEQLKIEGFDIKKTTKNNITTTRILGIERKITHKNTSNTPNTPKLNSSLIGDISEPLGITGITGILTHKDKNLNNFSDEKKKEIKQIQEDFNK